MENNYDELLGKKFGKLKIISYKIGKFGGVKCDCECECGKVKQNIPLGDLKSGHDKSCGCLKYKYTEDLTGQKFHKLTVLEFGGVFKRNNGSTEKRWKCQCECGKIIYISSDRLVKGKIKSCGCYTSELISKKFKKYNRYEFVDDYVIGYTTNHNLPFYVDLDDYEKIKDICWIDFKRGNMITLQAAYIKTPEGVKNGVTMHRYLGYKNYDHIDRNELNNRKSNLRPCTPLENSRNKNILRSNKSGFIGVWWDCRRNKWEAYIKVDGKKKHLGRFADKDNAIKTRLKAEKEYYKEFAPQRHLFDEYGI